MLTQTQSPTVRFVGATALTALITCIILILSLGRSRNAIGYEIVRSGPFTQKGGISSTSSCSSSSSGSSNGSWEFVTDRDANNHGLSEEQCRIAFPKLFVEIDKSASLRAERPISFAELDDVPVEDGMVRGIIDHGEVSVIRAPWNLRSNLLTRY